jgi:hypothetical protein
MKIKMKKISFFLSVLLVGCVMFMSCSHDDLVDEVVSQIKCVISWLCNVYVM